jgi:hypothetical protein
LAGKRVTESENKSSLYFQYSTAKLPAALFPMCESSSQVDIEATVGQRRQTEISSAKPALFLLSHANLSLDLDTIGLTRRLRMPTQPTDLD